MSPWTMQTAARCRVLRKAASTALPRSRPTSVLCARLAGDRGVPAHPAPGLQDVQPREVLQAPRLEPGLEASHFLVEIEVAELVPLVAEALGGPVPQGRPELGARQQPWYAARQGVSRGASRTGERPCHDMAVGGGIARFELQRLETARAGEVIQVLGSHWGGVTAGDRAGPGRSCVETIGRFPSPRSTRSRRVAGPVPRTTTRD